MSKKKGIQLPFYLSSGLLEQVCVIIGLEKEIKKARDEWEKGRPGILIIDDSSRLRFATRTEVRRICK